MICHEYGMLGGGGGGECRPLSCTSLVPLSLPTLGSDERQLYLRDKGGLT